MDQPKTTPKDVFLHLLMMVMLYISVISLITLSFAYINYLYPDLLIYGADNIFNDIRYSSSMLFVAFPLLLLLAWLVQRDFRKEPQKHDLKFRKWIVYLTLFVSAITIVVDLIQLINSFYGGELTIPFALKVVAVLVLAGAVFSYYIWDVQNEPQKSKIPVTVGWVSFLLVTGMLVLGFVLVGSPAKQREIRMDGQRVNDLQMLQSEIINYWQHKNALPVKLDDLKNDITGFTVPSDPETKNSYKYEATAKLKFKLCATFKRPNPFKNFSNKVMPAQYYYYPEYIGGTNQTWDHAAGIQCFERVIDPTLFNAIKK